jgi:hypothetical protein
MGILSVGVMNSTAFLLSANSNSKVDGNQISFGTIDFQTHPPTLTLIFAGLEQKMDLTIGSPNFHIGSLGSICLSDLTKSDLSAGTIATMAMSESLVGFSSEVNSPVSFTMTSIEDKIKELDEIMGNLDLGEAMDRLNLNQEDFTTRRSGVSSNVHKVCVIITKAAEENDDTNNIVVNTQGNKPRSNNIKEKEKNICLRRRVENYHVSNQSRHGGTRKLEKRSFNGISVCPASTQKEAARGNKRAQEKPGEQQCIKRIILG